MTLSTAPGGAISSLTLSTPASTHPATSGRARIDRPRTACETDDTLAPRACAASRWVGYGAATAAGVVEMTPGVRSFVLGFVFGVVACMGFVTYYGDLGGGWLIDMGQRMKTAAQTEARARTR